MTRTPADPDARGHGSQPGHMFGQDGNSIRKSGGLDVVDHLLEPKTKGKTSTEVESGGLNPSTQENGAANDLIYGALLDSI